MARIIVWAKRDNIDADAKLDARKFKPGHVVDVLEDGQSAGTDVEQGAWWRIVEVPGRAADYAQLLGADPEFADLLNFASKATFPRKRVNRMDIDTIEAVAGLKPGENPGQAITLSRGAVTLRTETVAKRDNPQVIGGDAGVIG